MHYENEAETAMEMLGSWRCQELEHMPGQAKDSEQSQARREAM
jgi:hypothetical protein